MDQYSDQQRFGALQQSLQDWAATNTNSINDRVTITVDRDRFIHTRNALTNAFVGLSGAIDEAVKAYVNHTNAVLDGVGGSTLDISGLMQPFNPIGQLNHVAHLAQQAILQNGNIAPVQQQNPQLNPDGTRKKRQYKPRDPNAPKRPLTAYFRYLQEQRPLISKELQANGPSEGGKAGDISKIATERWNNLDEKTRKPYRAAYESELGAYNEAVKQYKAATGQDVDATHVEDEDNSILPTPVQATAAAEDDDSDDEDDDDSSDDENGSESDSSSSSSEDDEPTPPPKPKQKSPEVPKKTPKSSAKKTAKAGADPVASVPQFSSLSVPQQAPVADMTPSQSKKRKGVETDASEKKKKRKSKSAAEQEEADAAAAAAQLQIDPQLQQLNDEKPKKDKKKKRKSEGAAAV